MGKEREINKMVKLIGFLLLCSLLWGNGQGQDLAKANFTGNNNNFLTDPPKKTFKEKADSLKNSWKPDGPSIDELDIDAIMKSIVLFVKYEKPCPSCESRKESRRNTSSIVEYELDKDWEKQMKDLEKVISDYPAPYKLISKSEVDQYESKDEYRYVIYPKRAYQSFKTVLSPSSGQNENRTFYTYIWEIEDRLKGEVIKVAPDCWISVCVNCYISAIVTQLEDEIKDRWKAQKVKKKAKSRE